MKLPYGLHLLSGERSYFCDDRFMPAESLNDLFSSLAKYSVENVKRVISAHISETGRKSGGRTEKIALDYERLGEMSDNVKQVLMGCSLMQYMVNKAMATGYLSHAERLSVLYVFGHTGEEGKQFVHTVMAYTFNYQYYITQKFIDKIPERPVSCVKLREQYKAVTAEYGCNCVFKRTKNCYPSPVIHAINKSSEEENNVTIPISRTVSKEKQQDVYQELNIHIKVQELAGKIVELKKQKRGIDKTIEKAEKELTAVFDSANVDCMEIDMGMLVRRKRESGYEWLIEI